MFIYTTRISTVEGRGGDEILIILNYKLSLTSFIFRVNLWLNNKQKPSETLCDIRQKEGTQKQNTELKPNHGVSKQDE